ncbi:formylmethanofuran dehydrogenase subunit C [Methanococcus voltae PS]|uniref:Formylmethanofuran dehydrogenase subunit C n=1 Tax=Methanococcus voltae PS TaxID=523842 RepID=A0ABT2EXG8_METVO|nr:formylmethanofuran dehydrogenase subunit C [Methanococcus voltae PS]
MFSFLKSKKTIENYLKNIKSDNILTIKLSEPLNCLLDYTYNFKWQSNFDENHEIMPNSKISYKKLVEFIKNPKNVIIIEGNVGKRFCSSLGADLKYFGGSGDIVNSGTVIINGDIDTRCGISMVSGVIYQSKKYKIKEPVGNIIEIESDIKDYKKFVSITDFLKNGNSKGYKILKPNRIISENLIISDNIIRDTVGARLDEDYIVTVEGNVDLSTGILMKKGKVIINGDAGKNTGAVLRGGTVIINGKTADFTGSDMKDGNIIVREDAGKYLAAKAKNGHIYSKTGSSIPPFKKYPLNEFDKKFLKSNGINNLKDYWKFSK